MIAVDLSVVEYLFELPGELEGGFLLLDRLVEKLGGQVQEDHLIDGRAAICGRGFGFPIGGDSFAGGRFGCVRGARDRRP